MIEDQEYEITEMDMTTNTILPKSSGVARTMCKRGTCEDDGKGAVAWTLMLKNKLNTGGKVRQ